MLENEDAGTNAGNGTATPAPTAPEISGPPSVPAQAPNLGATPQPAPPAAPAAQSQEPSQEPGHFFKHLSHAFAGALVGALAGPKQAVDHYEADETGKMKAVMRDLHPRDRLQLMAQAALEGLSAGSRVGPQKSKAAAWGAGIGAGGEAVIQRGQQQDLLKRQQAREDYETQQKAMTDKALRAAHNASTYSLWQKAMDEANDHDPDRKKNMDVVDAIKDFNERNPTSGLQVQIVSPDA